MSKCGTELGRVRLDTMAYSANAIYVDLCELKNHETIDLII